MYFVLRLFHGRVKKRLPDRLLIDNIYTKTLSALSCCFTDGKSFSPEHLAKRDHWDSKGRKYGEEITINPLHTINLHICKFF